MTEVNNKKVGMFLDEKDDVGLSKEIHLSRLGYNTGNQLFFHALKSQLPVKTLPRNTHKIENLDDYDAFVTTDFVWIRENVDMSYMNRYLQVVGDKALVPISIGLQADEYKTNFVIHPQTVAVLKNIEERCVMGVRGEYTAEILNKYGIKNVQVIGCPSVYQLRDKVVIRRKRLFPQNVSTSFRTFGERLSEKETEFLLYAATRDYSFVEQTEQILEKTHVLNAKKFDVISEWMKKRGKFFLELEDWRTHMRQMDFCMGSRFHGNVVALWEGVPALFMATDSRTRELCSFFDLPCMDSSKFNGRKNILHYMQKADYEKFNKTFTQKKERYQEFLRKNGLK